MRTFYDIVVRPLRLNAAGNKINWKGVELLLTVLGTEWNDVNYDGEKEVGCADPPLPSEFCLDLDRKRLESFLPDCLLSLLD